MRLGQLRSGNRCAALLVSLAMAHAADFVVAQDAANPAQMQKRFEALPSAQKEATLADALRRVAAIEDPALVRAVAFGTDGDDLPSLQRRLHHDEKVFAPVARTRVRIPASDPRAAKVRAEFPHVRLLRDLEPFALYDWLHGEAASSPMPLTASQRFANLASGYPPSADRAVARLLAILDRDGDQREVAAFCEHLYADRDGRVFEPVTLYEAWYSGRVVEVPDVDAIAFARNILQTDSFVSPIPDGRRRDRLYEQIRAAMKKHREYRTLCEAAAAAFVAAEPQLDPTYQPLVDRMHLLWAECGHAPAEFGKRLTESDRGELIAQLDERATKTPEGSSMLRESKDEKRRMGEAIRRACAEALDAAEQKAPQKQ